MTVGVLAFQGDFAEHIHVLESLGVKTKEVRTREDLMSVDRLINPGGESTVLSRFLKISEIDRDLVKKVHAGFPVFGTCAGAIVLAKTITNGKGPDPLGLIDIDVDRNAYGRQIDSFEAEFLMKGSKLSVKASFIRAPIISRVGTDVEILAKHKGRPIIVRQGKVLAATCHPEMRGETAVHKYFLKLQ